MELESGSRVIEVMEPEMVSESAANIAIEEMMLTEDRRLFQAARGGNTTLLGQLLLEDPDILSKETREGEDTVCHVAVRHGHSEFVSKVCSVYPQIMIVSDRKGSTLLHSAIEHKEANIFLDSVHLYCQYIGRLPEEERESLNLQWDRAVVNKQGKSLLYLAVERGDFSAAMVLLETPFLGKNCSGPNGATALHALVSKANKFLYSQNSNYSNVRNLLLQPERQLIRKKDECGNTPLHHAVYSCEDMDTIELLLEKDASAATILNSHGLSPVHLAVRLGREELIEPLIKHCPDSCIITTIEGQNALHIAMKKRKRIVARKILKHNEDNYLILSQQDKDGNTPLHIAASLGDFDTYMDVCVGMEHLLALTNKKGLSIVDCDDDYRPTEDTKNVQSSLLVAATLITTMTFGAAFAIPGGYNSDEPDKGIATLVRKTGFRVFLVSNTISLCSSIVATAALVTASGKFKRTEQIYARIWALEFILISLLCLLVAFAAAICTMTGSQFEWLQGIVVSVVCCCLFYVLSAAVILTVGPEKRQKLLQIVKPEGWKNSFFQSVLSLFDEYRWGSSFHLGFSSRPPFGRSNEHRFSKKENFKQEICRAT